MTMFDEAAWPLIYAVGWIAERDSEHAERLARLLHHGGETVESTRAWRDLRDALLAAKIIATGRKRTFKTVAEKFPSGRSAALFHGMQVIGPTHTYRQIEEEPGVREPIPALAWIDAVSPITGPANYGTVKLLRRDVLDQWRVTVKTVDSRGRGRPSETKKRVIEKMVRDLRAGELRGDELQKDLAYRYDVSRKTAKEALDNAMLQIQCGIIRK